MQVEIVQVEIESSGVWMRAERVVPELGTHPGVIVIHDGGGYGEHAIGVAHELAEAPSPRQGACGYEKVAVRQRGPGRPSAAGSTPAAMTLNGMSLVATAAGRRSGAGYPLAA